MIKITLFGEANSGKTSALRCLIYLLSGNGTSKLLDVKKNWSIDQVLQKQKDVRVAFDYATSSKAIAVCTAGDDCSTIEHNYQYFDKKSVRLAHGGNFKMPKIPDVAISACSSDMISEEQYQTTTRLKKDLTVNIWLKIEHLYSMNLPIIDDDVIEDIKHNNIILPKDAANLSNVKRSIAVAKFIKTQIDELIKL